jgi:predicted Rossmann fold nucleotide-binding protein DprA/Smf involved in DNA uptake
MTTAQHSAFARRLYAREWSLFVHGGAIGADEMAHFIALGRVPVHVRPCDIRDQQGFCPGAAMVYPERPPLLRNVDIVDACAVLVACPSGAEHRKSGTWATVRYARQVGREVVIVWPDGTVARDGGTR